METNLKSCYVFFTKGRPPIRIQAEDQLKACEEFYPGAIMKKLVNMNLNLLS